MAMLLCGLHSRPYHAVRHCCGECMSQCDTVMLGSCTGISPGSQFHCFPSEAQIWLESCFFTQTCTDPWEFWLKKRERLFCFDTPFHLLVPDSQFMPHHCTLTTHGLCSQWWWAKQCLNASCTGTEHKLQGGHTSNTVMDLCTKTCQNTFVDIHRHTLGRQTFVYA